MLAVYRPRRMEAYYEDNFCRRRELEHDKTKPRTSHFDVSSTTAAEGKDASTWRATQAQTSVGGRLLQVNSCDVHR